ncbi:MAG: multidrug efflux SMR transporter [Xanthomonadales bacterium]|nr:multidrug efflux SMR transporter [Xanthomonadales bacterium]
MKSWLFLAVAIVAEVIATSALKSSDGFTRPVPSMAVVVGYGLAFYFLALAFRTIPVAIAYAVWAGLGIVLVAAIAWLFHGQKLDLWALLGIGLIVSGVAVLNLLSKTHAH